MEKERPFYTPQGRIEFELEQKEEDEMNFYRSLLEMGMTEEEAKEVWKEYGSGGY